MNKQLPTTPTHYATVDCRTQQQFELGHFKKAINIPAGELFMRMHELPMRSEPLVLYADSISLTIARDFLMNKGYQISHEQLWTTPHADELQANDQLEIGRASHALWQAAPLIRRFVHEFMPVIKPQAGKGLDIGCGAGRDMVYLAQQGWQMLGIDHLSGALQRSQQLATQYGVSIETLQFDLEQNSLLLMQGTEQSFDLIYGVRYLHRPLFPQILRLLKPKGIFMYQTFMVGCEQLGGPRNPNYLLEPNELATWFKPDTILLDEIDYLNDGRPMSAFIAQLP